MQFINCNNNNNNPYYCIGKPSHFVGVGNAVKQLQRSQIKRNVWPWCLLNSELNEIGKHFYGLSVNVLMIGVTIIIMVPYSGTRSAMLKSG